LYDANTQKERISASLIQIGDDQISGINFSKQQGKEKAMNKRLPDTDTSTSAKSVSVADYIVERLAVEGIDHCFGLPAIMCFQSAMRSTAAPR
jgi:hypothetical protein